MSIGNCSDLKGMNLRTPSVASGSDVIREKWKLK